MHRRALKEIMLFEVWKYSTTATINQTISWNKLPARSNPEYFKKAEKYRSSNQDDRGDHYRLTTESLLTQKEIADLKQ